MKSLIAKCLCVVCFLAIVLLASGVRAQGPYEKPGEQQGQAPPETGASTSQRGEIKGERVWKSLLRTKLVCTKVHDGE